MDSKELHPNTILRMRLDNLVNLDIPKERRDIDNPGTSTGCCVTSAPTTLTTQTSTRRWMPCVSTLHGSDPCSCSKNLSGG